MNTLQEIQTVRWGAVAKRLLDIFLSTSMLLSVGLLMIIFTLLIKLDSDGPAFYRQVRVGMNNRAKPRRTHPSRREVARLKKLAANGRRMSSDRRETEFYGKPFPILKFRTMVVESEKDGVAVWCKNNDPRVTHVGNFLRKTHLDELPQLINILKGDMSLVGPRPERPEFVVQLAEKIPAYKNRLAVKPGLTGLAQIYHRADVVVEDVKKKVRYDMLYLKKGSVLVDLIIILGTVPLVFGLSMPGLKSLKKWRRFLSNRNRSRWRMTRSILSDNVVMSGTNGNLTNGK